MIAERGVTEKYNKADTQKDRQTDPGRTIDPERDGKLAENGGRRGDRKLRGEKANQSGKLQGEVHSRGRRKG